MLPLWAARRPNPCKAPNRDGRVSLEGHGGRRDPRVSLPLHDPRSGLRVHPAQRETEVLARRENARPAGESSLGVDRVLATSAPRGGAVGTTEAVRVLARLDRSVPSCPISWPSPRTSRATRPGPGRSARGGRDLACGSSTRRSTPWAPAWSSTGSCLKRTSPWTSSANWGTVPTWDAVTYTEEGSRALLNLDIGAFPDEVDEDFVARYIEDHNRELFFQKVLDWATEYEVPHRHHRVARRAAGSGVRRFVGGRRGRRALPRLAATGCDRTQSGGRRGPGDDDLATQASRCWVHWSRDRGRNGWPSRPTKNFRTSSSDPWLGGRPLCERADD